MAKRQGALQVQPGYIEGVCDVCPFKALHITSMNLNTALTQLRDNKELIEKMDAQLNPPEEPQDEEEPEVAEE